MRPRLPFARLGRDQRGVTALEFALLAPVMLVMFFGMVELSTAILTQRRAAHADSTIGDLVSQYGDPTYVNGVAQGTAPVNPAVTPASMTDVFTGGGLIIAPYPIPPFQARISSVVVGSDGKARVSWSCISTTSTTTTLSGPLQAVTVITATTSPSIPAGMLSSTTGDSIIVAESAYPYQSTLKYFLTNTLNFNNTYYYKPRASVSQVGFFPGASATTWNSAWDTASTATTTSATGVNCSYETG